MVLVLGMHRSGTSVGARLMECLGAVPSIDLMPAQDDNPRGFFEDLAVYEFNERELLPRLSRAWDSIMPVDWTALSDADRLRLAMQAIQIVRTNFSPGNSVSVLKEPRIGQLLPFWLSALAHCGYEVRVVCALRNPLSVAQSLAKRNGISTAHSSLLFITYWLSILNCLAGLPVAFIQFDEVLAEPVESAKKVAKKLGLPVPPDFARRMQVFTTKYLEPGLRHHFLNVRDLDLDPDVPSVTLELYRHLVKAAQSQNIAPALKFAAAKEKELSAIQPALAELDRLQISLQAEAGINLSLRQRAEDLQNEIKPLQETAERERLLVEERTNWARSLEGELEKTRALVEERTNWAKNLDAEVGRLRENFARNQDLEAKLAEAEENRKQLAAEREKLQSEKDELAARLAQLGSYVQDLEKQALERGALAEQITRQQTQLTEAEESRKRLSDERDELAKSLAQRFSELALLGKSIVAAEESAREIDERYGASRGSLAERITKLEDELQRKSEALRLLHAACCSASGGTIPSPPDTIEDYSKHAQQLIRQFNQLELKASELELITTSAEWHIAKRLSLLTGANSYRSKRKAGLKSLRKLVEESGLFDGKYYLSENPDVARSGMDPLEHYLLRGGAEGRNPSDKFDAASYLRKYPDLALNAGRMNPLVHYITFGQKEGRSPS